MKAVSLIIKIIILVAVIMLIVLAVNMCSGGSCVQRIDEMPPDATEAPWEVRTPTHIYYAEQAEQLPEGDVIISGWYEQVKEKWTFQDDTITLRFDVYGEIKVLRR